MPKPKSGSALKEGMSFITVGLERYDTLAYWAAIGFALRNNTAISTFTRWPDEANVMETNSQVIQRTNDKNALRPFGSEGCQFTYRSRDLGYEATLLSFAHTDMQELRNYPTSANAKLTHTDGIVFLFDPSRAVEYDHLLLALHHSNINHSPIAVAIINLSDSTRNLGCELEYPLRRSPYLHGEKLEISHLNSLGGRLRNTLSSYCIDVLSFMDKFSLVFPHCTEGNTLEWFATDMFSLDGKLTSFAYEEAFLWLLSKNHLYSTC